MRWQMIWSIIYLESRLFFRSGYKQSVAATIVMILFLNAFFSVGLSLSSSSVVSAIQQGLIDADFIFNYLLFVFNGLLMILIIFNTMSFLAISSRGEDVELLVPSPVTTAEVVAGKLVWNLVSVLLYTLFPLCVLVSPVSSLIGGSAAFTTFASAIIVIVVGSGLAGLIGCLFLRLFKPTKVQDKLLIIVSVASVIGVLGFQFAFMYGITNLIELFKHFSVETYLWYVSPATWAAALIWNVHMGTIADATIPLIGLATITLVIYLSVFGYAVKSYYPAITEAGITPRPMEPSARKVSYRLYSLSSLIGDFGYIVFLNESRITRRDTFRLMQLAMAMVPVAVFVFFGFLPTEISGGFHLGWVGSILPFAIGTTAIQCFGFDGETFQLLKSAPVKGKDIVLGKFAFYLTISSLLLASILPILATLFYVDPALTLIVLISSLLGSFGLLGFSMYVGVCWPEFKKVVTGVFGSQRKGVSFLGEMVFTSVAAPLYLFPNILVSVFSPWLVLVPSFIMFAIGVLALDSSFRKIEELEYS
jgi:hypothetical protein